METIESDAVHFIIPVVKKAEQGIYRPAFEIGDQVMVNLSSGGTLLVELSRTEPMLEGRIVEGELAPMLKPGVEVRFPDQTG